MLKHEEAMNNDPHYFHNGDFVLCTFDHRFNSCYVDDIYDLDGEEHLTLLYQQEDGLVIAIDNIPAKDCYLLYRMGMGISDLVRNTTRHYT